jgi:type II secretory pathway predicted ATPase ExeA
MRPREKYYEYWGLSKPPFDNVPDPEMYFDMHTSVENAVSETLFAIEEGNERLAVVVGDVGLGKTMALRVILDSLYQDNYRIAFVTNPDMTFIQLMKEIIGQLTGEQCLEGRREKILETFNQLLFATQEEGKKVLLFIDGANAMKSASLESLRLLTNMQRDDENLFTLVLAGQLELAQRLEHPRRANLFQRIGVYCRLSKIDNRDLMRDYIEHRLERAGARRPLFTETAYDAIWEYSECGVPRLVNKVAKLALKAGQTQQVQTIDAPIVRQIGLRFGRMSAAILPERRERTRDNTPDLQEPEVMVTTVSEDVPTVSAPPPPSPAQPSVAHEDVCTVPEPHFPVPAHPSVTEEEVGDQADTLAQTPAEADVQAQQAIVADIIKFPDHIYTKAKKLPTDQRLRFAGQLAAEVLKKYPQLIQQLGTNNDPVPAWNVLRNVVMRQIDQHLANESILVDTSL